MNRQITIITVAAVLGMGLLLAGWWMLKGVPQSVSTSERADETANDIVGATPSTTPADQGTQKPRQEDRSKSILQAIEGTNVPINFWGKIIDQNGRPIADVKVNYSYSTEHGSITGAAWAQQEIHKGETNTSERGTFAVTNLAGHNLTIEFLTREGYEYRPKGAMVYDFYGSSAEGRFTSDVNHPVFFVMINKSTAEPLVSYGGNLGKIVRVPGNGTAVRWNLWKGQSDPEGELRIKFERQPAVLARVGPPEAWSAKIEIVGGGIVTTNPDQPFYRAPEEGYTPAVDYPKAEQTRGMTARSFYVKTSDGKYGRLQLELYPGDDGPAARCLIKVTMNPTGSRNLETDK